MYYLNKLVGCSITPIGIALAMIFIGIIFNYFKSRGSRWAKGGKWLLVASAVWLWLWSTPIMTFVVGAPLEREFLVDGKVPKAQSYPQAEAILLLGGGMGGDVQLGSYDEMWTSADRVWMAAELYKSGKAPKIYVTGGSVKLSTGGLLRDFDIPSSAVVYDENPRNTEEEAKAAAKRSEKKVLLVTSAWHMKRACMMFERYAPGVKVIPAPRDFENTLSGVHFCEISAVIPSVQTLSGNSVSFHEWLGILGYKFFR